jgi:hypothetical protein
MLEVNQVMNLTGVRRGREGGCCVEDQPPASSLHCCPVLHCTHTHPHPPAIRDPQEAWERHIEDSLALLPVIDAFTASHMTHSAGARLCVVDVGSGAGLPGMVLAVVRPDWQVSERLRGPGGEASQRLWRPWLHLHTKLG